jgi:hypothetical protein
MANGLDGIFEHLVDKAAFVDTLGLSVRGKRRKRMSNLLRILRTLAIGGKKRIFSTASHGLCTATGNKFQLKYGLLRRFPNAPDFKLILYANETPITLAHVVLILNCLFRAGFRVTVSRLELTFDLTGSSVEFFRQRLMTRAKRVWARRDGQGRMTLYAGRRTSAWQLCVYVKTPTITRFEFVLRSGELRRLGVRHPSEIIFLRRATLLGRLVALCDIDESRVPRVDTIGNGDDPRARAIRSWAKTLTRRQFYFATRRAGSWRPEWLRQCSMETKLRTMQDRLVW